MNEQIQYNTQYYGFKNICKKKKFLELHQAKGL